MSKFDWIPSGVLPSSKRVVVGLSGGVDSSVSALLLKEAGFDVVGLFMRNWDDESEHCPAVEDYEDVAQICDQIGIPYYTVNFVKEYWEEVFADFLEAHKRGETPNPDILCNRHIKFKHFLRKAKSLEADYLATGHYCRLHYTEDSPYLLKGLDPNKDQSYFLHGVQKGSLDNVLFPIGHLPKSQVRQIALESELATANKKDSTGICFIGKRPHREFLQNYLEMTPGAMKTPEGAVVGEHIGLPYYTVGQRKGLGIGGPGDAWFVVDKDHENNALVVAQGINHPSLFAPALIAREPTWINGKGPQFPWKGKAKIRYRQEDQTCSVELQGSHLFVAFEEPQRAITPGQSVVFYEGDRCLGGAIISDKILYTETT